MRWCLCIDSLMTVCATSSILNVPVLFFTGIGEFSKVGDTVGLRTGHRASFTYSTLWTQQFITPPFQSRGTCILEWCISILAYYYGGMYRYDVWWDSLLINWLDLVPIWVWVVCDSQCNRLTNRNSYLQILFFSDSSYLLIHHMLIDYWCGFLSSVVVDVRCLSKTFCISWLIGRS